MVTLTLSAPPSPVADAVSDSEHKAKAKRAALVLTAALATLWAVTFSYLAVVRHFAGGTHAEDLGFTDQVLSNFLQGQWFRMSIYTGATWNTELDITKLARPDSLLAFHFEPMLLALVPFYAVLQNPTALLVLQAAAVAAGAIPAFRIARHLTRSSVASFAVGFAYLLSPLGQWAVLADFHTSTLAAPLLLLCVERLIVARAPVQAVLTAAAAAFAREDAAVVVTVLGAGLLLNPRSRRAGSVIGGVGVITTIAALLVIRKYSGGVSPFEVRYGPTLLNPLAALSRPLVVEYASTLLLSGGWLAVFAPLALLPALPSLALNILSTSPWMASGQAHYSGLVLPFVVLGAAAALARLAPYPKLQHAASGALCLTALTSYLVAGAGPLAANYAPAAITPRAQVAADMAANLPAQAAVSASTSLVPRLSQRSRAYVFPAVVDADYVFLDLKASPAPTSARDVYLRAQDLLANGWRIARQDDGLLLLERGAARTQPAPAPSPPPTPTPVALNTVPELLDATLVPSPDGSIDVDGPRWILRTTWQTDQPLAPGAQPEFWITLSSGEQLHLWDIADLWWDPPEQWPLHQPVTIDVPDIPIHTFASWSATWDTHP